MICALNAIPTSQDPVRNLFGIRTLPFYPPGTRTVFFASTDGVSRSWFVSDGTAAGTQVLKTFPIGPGFQVQKVVGGDDRAYWLKVVTGGFEVWQTDGSEVGSGRAITSGQLQLNSGFLPEFAMAGDQLVFSALSG